MIPGSNAGAYTIKSMHILLNRQGTKTVHIVQTKYNEEQTDLRSTDALWIMMVIYSDKLIVRQKGKNAVLYSTPKLTNIIA